MFRFSGIASRPASPMLTMSGLGCPRSVGPRLEKDAISPYGPSGFPPPTHSAGSIGGGGQSGSSPHPVPPSRPARIRHSLEVPAPTVMTPGEEPGAEIEPYPGPTFPPATRGVVSGYALQKSRNHRSVKENPVFNGLLLPQLLLIAEASSRVPGRPS